jgi:hypothetical protein
VIKEAEPSNKHNRVKRQFIHFSDGPSADEQHGEMPDPYLFDSLSLAAAASASSPLGLGLGPLDLPDANFLSTIQVSPHHVHCAQHYKQYSNKKKRKSLSLSFLSCADA